MATSSNTHSQASYGVQPAGVVGEFAESSANRDTINRVNGEATEAIAFGRAVMRDTTSGTTKRYNCKEVAGTSPEIMGIAVVSSRQSATDSDDRTYAAGDDVLIATQGDVWCEAAGTLAAGDTPYIVTSGADQGLPGPSTAGGTAPQVSATLSGVLDDGQARVQTLTADADFVGGDTLDLDIGGATMPQLTFNTSHGQTMLDWKTALEQTLADDNQQALVDLSDIGGTNRVITISSLGSHSATSQAITGIVASGLAVVAADQQAGAAAASLSMTVDGDTVSSEWAGSSDDTWHAFATELAGHSKVASAVVTEVLNGPDLVITLTGANKVADDIDLAAATVTGGAVARTIAVNNEVTPGVAQTAVEWTSAIVRQGGADGEIVKISVAVLPKP